MTSGCCIFCEILLAILLPPLGVCLRHGCCTVEFFICLVLTILEYIPGIINWHSTSPVPPNLLVLNFKLVYNMIIYFVILSRI
ncbi:hypothetical protein ACS0TY_007592 [Phlomoides rotata]